MENSFSVCMNQKQKDNKNRNIVEITTTANFVIPRVSKIKSSAVTLRFYSINQPTKQPTNQSTNKKSSNLNSPLTIYTAYTSPARQFTWLHKIGPLAYFSG